MSIKVPGYPSRLHPFGIAGQEDQLEAIKTELRSILQFKTVTNESQELIVACSGPYEYRGFCPHSVDVTYSVSCAYIPSYRGQALSRDSVDCIVQMLLLRSVSPKEYARDLAGVLCSRHLEKDWSGLTTLASRVQVSYFCECKACCNGGFGRESLTNSIPGPHEKSLENHLDQYLFQKSRSPSGFEPQDLFSHKEDSKCRPS